MNAKIQSITLINENQTVLLRSDWNVPFYKKKITNSYRIDSSLNTLNFLCKNKKSKVILLAHLGRPLKPFDVNFSFKPLLSQIEKRISPLSLLFIENIYSDTDIQKIKNAPNGSVILIDNIRFYENEVHPSSEKRLEFAKHLATLGTAYVNDAFGVAHRKHASTYEITKLLPSYAGYLLEKEVQVLTQLLKNPKRPFTAIIGGSKLSTKLNIINPLLNVSDHLIIGGAMAYTFLKALGQEIGTSCYEPNFLEQAKEILEKTKKNNKQILLPSDHTITDKFDGSNDIKYNSPLIPKDYMGVDIGTNTFLKYINIVQKSQTILWNGPMGVFENPKFKHDKTRQIARVIANCSGTTVIGGGDSLSVIFQENLQNKFTHLSTGGGATLTFIENLTLPVLEALKRT